MKHSQKDGRRIDLNQGLISDRDIPGDGEIVGAIIVLRDEQGEYRTYVSGKPQAGAREARTPEPEVTEILAAHVAQAWTLANL